MSRGAATQPVPQTGRQPCVLGRQQRLQALRQLLTQTLRRAPIAVEHRNSHITGRK